METTDNPETVHTVNAEIVFQQDRAAIDIQIATAKTYPRNITRATQNAIAIVSMDKETAATCTYSVPRGGKSITGPSTHLAKILAQNWGNLRVDARVVMIDDKHVTSEAVCFDLENNLAWKAQVKRSIVDKHGRRFNDDMITVTGNAANSISSRNAILAVIPRSIVEKVYQAAKDTILGQIKDKNQLIAERNKIFAAFKDEFGITEEQLLSIAGKPSIGTIGKDDLVVIIGVGTSLRSGDVSIEDVLKSRKKPGEEKKKDLKEKKDDKGTTVPPMP